MSHVPALGPFREFNLADEPRTQPGGLPSLQVRLFGERTFFSYPWCEKLHKLFLNVHRKARAAVTDIHQLLIFVHPQDQGTERRTALFGISKAADEGLLALKSLDL